METNRHLGYRWYGQSEDREFGGAQDPLYSQSSPISFPFFEYSELHPHGCFLEVWMLCRKDVRNVFTRSPWKTSKKTWETDIPTRELWAEKGSLPRRRTASRRTLRRSDSWTHCEISGYNHLLRESLQGLSSALWWELALASMTFSEEKWNDCKGEYILCKSCFNNARVTVTSFVLWSILRSRQFYFHLRQRGIIKGKRGVSPAGKSELARRHCLHPSQPLSVTSALIITSLACCEISN